MLEYLNGELFTYALTIGMTPNQYWNENPQWFYNYSDSYNNTRKIEMEQADYLAWRTGESVKSALETTAILSLMVDGKEAKKALKNAKYQELPYFMLVEREKNNKNKNNKDKGKEKSKLSKSDKERIKANMLSDEERIANNQKMMELRNRK